mgnify:CR=1 FL=1
MAIHTFAAIYIGSYEVSLKIFELSAKKKIRDIDYVRSRIELGADAYSKGSIGYELVEALCDTLREFAQIMKEYRVDAYEAYASAVLRDVDNELFILDQIRLRTGLTVHVLSNSEHRFISYKSVAMREEFEHFIGRSAAVVDVSGSGLQITVFSKGKVLTTQHLGLGTMRMREQLAKKSRNLAQYELQIEEMVVKEMEVFKAMYLENQEIEYLIVIGDYIAELVCRLEKNHNKNTVSIEKFVQYMEQLGKKSLEEIAEELDMPVGKVREILKIAQEPVSLETPIGEEEDSHLGDFIPDTEMMIPADAAAFTLLKEQLLDVLGTLTEREQKVLRLRFGLDDGRARTLEEVGKEFNVTRERIRQIEAKALRKLRHPSRSKKLKDYLE